MTGNATPPPYEILEHTADIGLRARGDSPEALFENCARGLAEILDRHRTMGDAPDTASVNMISVALQASDVEALLVEWMNEVLFMLEPEGVCLGPILVQRVTEGKLTADVALTDCSHEPEGTELKAATYHQLSVRTRPSGWEATVYFDV